MSPYFLDMRHTVFIVLMIFVFFPASCQLNEFCISDAKNSARGVYTKYITVPYTEKDMYTVCPRGSDPFCIFSYYMNWVTILLGHIVQL